MRRIDDTAIILSSSDQLCELAKACQVLLRETPLGGVWSGLARAVTRLMLAYLIHAARAAQRLSQSNFQTFPFARQLAG